MATQIAAEEAVIDRTQVLNPATLWPDPMDCPDWPQVSATTLQHMSLVTGKAPAEAKLDTIGRHLNRNARQLRAPTQAEREAEFDQVFDHDKAPLPRWQGLGLSFGPRKRLTEDEAALIVEAAHLRGYIRKLDSAAEAEKAAKEREAVQRDERRVEAYERHLADSVDELERLREGAERHRQREEDELAFRRFAELKDALKGAHRDACRAAERLGRDLPTAPVFPDAD